MKPYTIIFFSSSELAMPLLEQLHQDERFQILALICQPDKEAGRAMELQEHEIKKLAVAQNIPVYQPEKLSKATELLEIFQKSRPDFLLTFSYGQWLSEAWLALPVIAPLNVHPSLLPKYRGPTPIQSAILNGDSETGISLMKMSAGMDEGPVASQVKCPVPAHATSAFMFEEIGKLAAEKLPDAIFQVGQQGEAIFKAQDESQATLCQKIEREDGRVNFQEPARQILNRFRAYTPWPGLFTTFEGKRLKFLDVEVVNEVLEPGKIRCDKHDILIGTSDGSLKVKQLQLEGKKAMHTEMFILGQPTFCSGSLPS